MVYKDIVGRRYDQFSQRRTVAISLYKNCKSMFLTNLAEKNGYFYVYNLIPKKEF